jgi:hypothetical protein
LGYMNKFIRQTNDRERKKTILQLKSKESNCIQLAYSTLT